MKKKIIEIKSKIIGVFIGLGLGVVLMLTGCGEKNNPVAEESTESTRVIEKLDDSGETVEEEYGGDDTQITDSIREIEILEFEKNYLEYMSDDELKALAVEALADKGLDTRLAEGKLTTRGVTFELPEKFMESEDVPGLYITKRYPIDAANIRYIEAPVDYTLQLMDKDYFRELVEVAFLEEMNITTSVNITEFKSIKIDSVPAFRIKAEYDLEDNHITNLMYAINGSKTYLIIYSMSDDYDRMDWFEESAASIHVKR